jgi:dihydroorotate dehydrogenase (fumarate)
MEVLPALEPSSSTELRLPLRWVAILHRRHRVSLAASTGVHEVRNWMDRHGFETVGQLRGRLSQRSVPNPAAFERANYIKTLASHAADPPGSSRVGVVLRPVRGNVTDLGTPWGE